MRGGSCHVDHQITWLDQWAAPGEPALTVCFGRSVFVGYQFGDLNMLSTPRNPPGGWGLATNRGLRVGDTLARGRRRGLARGVTVAPRNPRSGVRD
jgi:hypothetical protein